MFRAKYLWLLIALVLAIGLRIVVLAGDRYELPVNGSMQREGAAYALYKGWGFKNFTIPQYRNSGHLVDPIDYLRWKGAADPDTPPSNMADLSIRPGPSYILSLTYEFFGLRYIYYQTAQMLITVLDVALVFFIGYVFFQSLLAAVIASLLCAGCLYEMELARAIAREVAFKGAVVHVLAGLALLVWLSRKYGYKLVLGAGQNPIPWQVVVAVGAYIGAIIGVTEYFRGVLVPVLGISVFGSLLLLPLRKAMACMLAVIVVAGAVMYPGMQRGKEIFGTWSIGQDARYLAAWGGLGYGANAVGMNATDTVSLSSAALRLRLSGKEPPSYYDGGTYAYDQVAKEAFVQYIEENPYSYLKLYISNLWENLTNVTEWAYYDLRSAIVPRFSVVELLLGSNGTAVLIHLWIMVHKVVPFLGLAGLVWAAIRLPYASVLLFPAIFIVLGVSVVASHHIKYIMPVLIMYYLGIGFLFSRIYELFKARN